MKFAGIVVHIFTGLGAVCALLAVEAIYAGDWARVFVWLGVAFLIDGIDGPFARAVDVQENLPRFSGERIDLVIDYMTYVFVPVLALLLAGRLPQGYGHALAAIILLSSLFHFSDVESKSHDMAFVGFPAIWNILAFYVFALDMSPLAATASILAATALTFVPLHWLHPVRVQPLRPLTLTLTVAWAVAAMWSVQQEFPAPLLAQVVLVGVALYGLGLSAWLSRQAWH